MPRSLRSLPPDVSAPKGRSAAISDRRLLRGLRSRRAILHRAVGLASLEGLNGLSLGRLAADLGLSKSGVQALFGTKENLQVATAEFAQDAFHETVVEPTLAAPPGRPRLDALIERWITYAEEPLFAGGCFWAANVADFDSRPGPVRDILVRQKQEWRDLIAAELKSAVDAGEIATLDVNLVAFAIDAVLTAANTAFRLGDENAAHTVREAVKRLLVAAA